MFELCCPDVRGNCGSYQVLKREIDVSGMQECSIRIINERAAWTQVVKNHSSSQNLLTDNFAECESRFVAGVLPDYQRGSEKFSQLLKLLGKPKEYPHGETRFAWCDVDGTDHRIIKAYVAGARFAKTALSLDADESVIAPYVTTGEAYINIERGVACVVTQQDMLVPWTKVQARVSTLCSISFFRTMFVYEIQLKTDPFTSGIITVVCVFRSRLFRTPC